MTHSLNHSNEGAHHHHTHAGTSRHDHGHHLLQIEGLSVGFERYEQTSWLSSERSLLPILSELQLSVHAGELLAVIGASGSGKTVLADAIMGIYETNAQVSGTIYFDGERQTAQSLQCLRGKEIAFVPQSITSLDPLMKVGKQIGGSLQQRKALYERYKLDEHVEYMYPHELSGGMARRVLLCTALINNPKLIIADEPTPGLDLELAVAALQDFRAFADAGGGVLLITHDIELALRVADRVAVFKDGTVIEETAVENFEQPELLQHPFTRQLWYALPEHEFSLHNEGVV